MSPDNEELLACSPDWKQRGTDDQSSHLSGAQRAHKTPATLARTPNFEALLIALRRRWLFACLLGLPLAALVAFAVWTLVPSAKFQVRAMVHIASAQETLLGTGAQDSETQFVNFQKTQMTLVKSQIVVEGVLSDPQVAVLRTVVEQDSPKEWLLRQLEVDFTQGPEILRIGLKGDGHDDLVILANAVMRVYLDEFVNTEEKRRSARLAQLDRILSEHKKRLNDLRAEFANLLVKVGEPLRREGGVQDWKLQQLEKANERLRTAQASTGELEKQLVEKTQLLNAKAEALVKPAALEAEINTDPLVDAYRKSIVELQAREADLRKRYTPEFFKEQMKKLQLREELELIQTELDKQIAKRRQEATEKLRKQAVEELKTDVAVLHEKLKLDESQRGKIASEIREMANAMKDVGRDAFQMNRVAKEVEEEEKLVSTVSADIRAVQLQALAPPRAKPLDKAIVSSLGVEKKKLLFAGGGSLGVLGLIIFGVAWYEFSQRKLHSVDEVIHGFGVELVGALPALSRRARRLIGTEAVDGSTRWTHLINSYRMLLLRTAGPTDVRSIMVTSAHAGEGKTSLSTHLAVSIARSGLTTLLIDSDMRKPTLHRLFGISRGPGLGEVVRGEKAAHEVIRPTPIPGLWILTAGEMTATTPDALARESTRALFAQLREEFDILLIDSCPLLPVADTLMLAQYVDGVILSLMRGVSRLPKLSATLHRLRLLGTPVLGAVVNGTDEDVYGSEYYVSLSSEAG